MGRESLVVSGRGRVCNLLKVNPATVRMITSVRLTVKLCLLFLRGKMLDA